MTEKNAEEIKQAVVERYGAFAREKLAEVGGTGESCCGSSTPAQEPAATEACCGSGSPKQQELAERLYAIEDLSRLPDELAEMSRGCGNPIAIAELKPGEAVLDLGSGAGLDCFLAAQAVGPSGRVVGLDMNEDMLRLARRNAERVGTANVEFRQGEMEAMPFGEGEFDVIISNCVINLSPDKDAVFRESLRVLKPGGRLRVSDIAWTRQPTAAEVKNLDWAGCVAGALTVGDYRARLEAAGFTGVRIEMTVTDGAGNADITAMKPGGEPEPSAAATQGTSNFRCC